MIALLMVASYSLIIGLFVRDFIKGLKVHKATLSYRLYGVVPRFTVRLTNGRFKANKVGVFYVATH
ncbi:hypothetical protein [Pectobacterium phage Jarilo]|uniref:Uncharacterized protein n=1 Tax=Pectobacterium phage Jarilo TaxID=2163634 RepID=A0A2S1GSX5_9CAUD|nr:hypothetical protein HOT17_gp02 [Pectobacterium phage Jarilo]AWD92483.1 hypothetical protein [Pectobacterium phage Jarilo]